MSLRPSHPRLRWRPRPVLWEVDIRPTSVSLHADLDSLRDVVSERSRNEVFLITRMRLPPSPSSPPPSSSKPHEQPSRSSPMWTFSIPRARTPTACRLQKVSPRPAVPSAGAPSRRGPTSLAEPAGHARRRSPGSRTGTLPGTPLSPTSEPMEPWIEGVVPYELANDGRRLVWTPGMMLCPSIGELPGVMAWLHKGLLSDKKIKAGGSFHAWSNIAVTDGIHIAPDNLKLLARAAEEVPAVYKNAAEVEQQLLIRCGSGNRLREVNQYAWEQGLAFPALGGSDGQTIGGVFNTGTHGSVLTTSHLVEVIASLDFVLATGNLVRIEPAGGITDPAAFAAAYNSQGCPPHPRQRLLQRRPHQHGHHGRRRVLRAQADAQVSPQGGPHRELRIRGQGEAIRWEDLLAL